MIIQVLIFPISVMFEDNLKYEAHLDISTFFYFGSKLEKHIFQKNTSNEILSRTNSLAFQKLHYYIQI